MRRYITLLPLVFISLILSCGEKNEKENIKIFVSDSTEESDKSSISLEFVLYDSVTTSQVLIIRDKLEHNAERILDFFKIKAVDTFKVHVWGNYENYLIAQELYAGQRYEGSRGYVISSNELAMFLTDDIEETAEHEFVHAVSLCVDASNPRWLWESVATYVANEFIDPNEINYLKNSNYPTIAELNGDFNHGNFKIYDVGHLLSEFIIHKWGKEKYLELIKSSGDLQKVFNITDTDFETEWANFVNAKYFKHIPS